jgi:hypothetical protein
MLFSLFCSHRMLPIRSVRHLLGAVAAALAEFPSASGATLWQMILEPSHRVLTGLGIAGPVLLAIQSTMSHSRPREAVPGADPVHPWFLSNDLWEVEDGHCDYDLKAPLEK